MWARSPRKTAETFFLVGVLVTLIGCETTSEPRNDLSAMKTAEITIKDQTFEVWIADDDETRSTGLMNVTQEEMAPADDRTHRGMLFVFDREQFLSFWMKNTIIPLDIAYIRQDGQIVSIHTMAPLETRTYGSVEPALYALEVTAGLYDQLGIQAGDHVEFPESLLKASP
jgi:uncharacterized membrane protein (UPF0127 family)